MEGNMRILIVVLAVAFVGLAAWALTYPSANDPKNPRYVFWKAGLYGMNPDIATETMIGDSGRDKIVVGKTKLQLRNKFGYLVAPADASPYLMGCYKTSPWKDRDALFIRKSPWMVVFDGERATDLVLVKGC
jgi:hypothetical protein